MFCLMHLDKDNDCRRYLTFIIGRLLVSNCRKVSESLHQKRWQLSCHLCELPSLLVLTYTLTSITATNAVIVRVCNCCTLLYVHSSFTIILTGKRELVALLSLSSWCLVFVVWLFLAVSWVGLQFVIVVFPDHTHFLFLLLPYQPL